MAGDTSPKPVLLISHGYRGHKDWGFWPYIANRFAERGFYTVSYNFSRIDARKNQKLTQQEKWEAETVYRELSDLDHLQSALRSELLPSRGQADVSKVAILGHSRAASSAIIYAADHPGSVQAVVAWNGGGVPQPHGPAAAENPELSLDVERQGQRYDTVKRLKELAVPALIVQGLHDLERTLENNSKLRETASEQTFIEIPGADHAFGLDDPFTGTNSYLEGSTGGNDTILE
ncbi:alpha/beta hydrolase family protein [Paenibacillus chartarius]|uniref:Alpha/beta hydrolase family protein n=1 Tax=Paenibacillus chartarius TaxID=747481 RepID=A0ABV6DE02_9BACL